MVLPRQLVVWFQLRTLTLVSVGALLGQGANLLICRQADANLRAATLQIALLSSLERQAVQPAATVSAEERARSAVALADQIQAGILELRNLRTGLNPGQAPVPLLPWEGVADRGARMLLDHSQEAETDLERWRTAVLTQARPAVAAEQRLALHRLNDRQVAQLPALLQEREASGRLGLSVMLTVLALAWLLGLLFALRAGRRLRSPMQQLDQIMTECTDLTATAPVVVERRPAPTALFSLSRGFQDLLLKLQAVIERLIKQARTDSLTDVGNRRCFDETFDREWRRGMRSQAELSLLLIDVDHFKQYNDRYGHVLGDACLRQVVAA
ncbi:MAG: diguanylate cyclase, partial [Cyanobium sp.]